MIHENTFKKVAFNGAKGIVMLGDNMLVYRRDGNTQNSPFCIDLPGGGREEDETPFETFKREVQEEFGLDINKDEIIFSYSFPSTIAPGEESYFFVTKNLTFKPKDIVFGNEGTEWMLMTPEEFISHPDGIKRQQERVEKYLSI